jgi:hypothetical protein
MQSQQGAERTIFASSELAQSLERVPAVGDHPRPCIEHGEHSPPMPIRLTHPAANAETCAGAFG